MLELVGILGGDLGKFDDPGITSRFNVLVFGIPLGSFTKIEGLNYEYEVTEYAEGGENRFTHKLPGRMTYSNIVLTRAVDWSSIILNKYFLWAATAPSNRELTITAITYNNNKTPVMGWTFCGAWPVKYTGPTFEAGSSSTVATETYEFAHQGILL